MYAAGKKDSKKRNQTNAWEVHDNPALKKSVDGKKRKSTNAWEVDCSVNKKGVSSAASLAWLSAPSIASSKKQPIPSGSACVADIGGKKKRKCNTGGQGDSSQGGMAALPGVDAQAQTPAAVANSRAASDSTNALDDIFGGMSAKKAVRDAERAAKEAEAEAIAKAERKAKKARQAERMKDNVFGEEYPTDFVFDPQNAKVHRFDRESGFNVFKAHHLGLGHGGNTPLCPFDCKCCY